jgi:hypothetical protein
MFDPRNLRCVAYGIAACLASSAAASQALAEAPAPLDGARAHDGFYLRVANGFGAFDERLSSRDDASVSGRGRGIVTLAELALGGTIAPGWVVGGGIYAADLLAGEFRREGAAPPPELDPGLRSVALIGPFVDVYLDPRRGLHLQGALGLASLTPRVFGHPATEQSEYLALGGGLMLGAGYDVWIADEWSLGVLARSTVSIIQGESDDEARFQHVVVTSPGLLVSLTFH